MDARMAHGRLWTADCQIAAANFSFVFQSEWFAEASPKQAGTACLRSKVSRLTLFDAGFPDATLARAIGDRSDLGVSVRKVAFRRDIGPVPNIGPNFRLVFQSEWFAEASPGASRDGLPT